LGERDPEESEIAIGIIKTIFPMPKKIEGILHSSLFFSPETTVPSRKRASFKGVLRDKISRGL
jgi:hypothetical protein